MLRSSSVILLLIGLGLTLTLTGCLGKSSNSGSAGIASINLTPVTSLSIDVGATQVFTASARDSQGRAVVGADIQFQVISGDPNSPAPLQISPAGNACAGSWDSGFGICAAGTSGIALVTAVAGGVSSPSTTVYVHQHVDSVQVQTAESQDWQYDCFPQGQAWKLRGVAFSNNVDITNTVGPFNWSFSNPGVTTLAAIVAGTPQNPVYQEQTTAKTPGITQLFASISGTTSAPYLYTTCLVKEIHLQIGGQASAGSSTTVNNGGSVPLTATVLDTLYHVVDFGSLATPPLTWSTTNPEVVGFTTASNNSGTNNATARANLGGGTITASCAPPTCNIGVTPAMPVYASDGLLPNGSLGYGAIAVDVTTTAKPPTYTAWATTTGCQNNDVNGCTSALFSVIPGTTPIGAIVTLPRTPNSMLFNPAAGGRLYIGTHQGLMFVDVTAATPAATLISNSPSPCNVSLCGKVLAISNDGKLVVVSDTVSATSQVYIYNSAATQGQSGVTDLIIPGQTATSATFSPDQTKLFILTSAGNLYVYSTVDALSSIPVAASASDIKFAADGSFAYIAGTPASSVTAYSTCSLPGIPTQNIGTLALSSAPLQLFPAPAFQADSEFITQTVAALEPPNIEFFAATFKQTPVKDGQLICNPTVIKSGGLVKGASFNLGVGNFTPIYTQLVANGSEMLVVAQNVPAVLVLNVANGTTSPIPLVGNANPLAADASTDGSQVYVAACDQYAPDGVTCAVASVHIINTVTPGDTQQVQYVNVNNNNDRNMCNNNSNPAPQCWPNMIAIRPQ